MNKKVATALFIIAGTLLNLLLMCLYIIGLLTVTSLILEALGHEPGSTIYGPFLIISILLGVVAAFFTYSRVVRVIQNKFDLERYLAPIFTPKRRKY